MRRFHRSPLRRVISALLLTCTAAAAGELEPAVERAHEQLWKRFFDRHSIMLDHAGLNGEVILPTAEELRLGKPNALAWWTAPENGAMFNGMYMEAAIHRWRLTGREEDKLKARRLAAGLMKLASCSAARGFIARGFSEDGAAHPLMGSNDQTGPWIYGMWRYLQSDIPDAQEQRAMRSKLAEVMQTLRSTGWRMPAEEPFKFRGSFAGFTWEHAPRLLMATRIMAQLTGEEEWATLHAQLRDERDPAGGLTRLEVCRRGMIFEHERKHSWTGASSVIMLRALWELETEPAIRAAYAEGLRRSAELAAHSLEDGFTFDPSNAYRFELDWRVINEEWTPQETEQEAVELAIRQLKKLGKLSPRRGYEMSRVREPVFAAWIVTLCPDHAVVELHAQKILRLIRHYPYERLYVSQFFPVESAYYRLVMASEGK